MLSLQSPAHSPCMSLNHLHLSLFFHFFPSCSLNWLLFPPKGFATWPTCVKFPEFNFSYTYSVGNSPYKRDVVADFVRDARAVGVKVGFYYSVVSNAYLRVDNGKVVPGPAAPNQVNVTQTQYEKIVLAQLVELWSNYGDLEEIWSVLHGVLSWPLTSLKGWCSGAGEVGRVSVRGGRGRRML